jgi:hypothetical protein
VCLHAGAALFHHFIRRDDVLEAMAPAIRRQRGPVPTPECASARAAITEIPATVPRTTSKRSKVGTLPRPPRSPLPTSLSSPHLHRLPQEQAAVRTTEDEVGSA